MLKFDRQLSGEFELSGFLAHSGSSDTRVASVALVTDGSALGQKGKPLKLRHYDISRAHFQGTLYTLNFPQRIVRSIAMTKLAVCSRACTEL